VKRPSGKIKAGQSEERKDIMGSRAASRQRHRHDQHHRDGVAELPAVSVRGIAAGGVALRALATGALAAGAAATGALAIGALAVGRLKVGNAEAKKLTVGRLEVDELLIGGRVIKAEDIGPLIGGV
jgi:hypothetical protein